MYESKPANGQLNVTVLTLSGVASYAQNPLAHAAMISGTSGCHCVTSADGLCHVPLTLLQIMLQYVVAPPITYSDAVCWNIM